MIRPRGFLFDMDGVLYRGGKPIAPAIAFLRRLQKSDVPFLLVTNHSCLTPAQYAAKLGCMGIRVAPAQIYTSSLAAAEWLKSRRVRSVFAIGESGLFAALKSARIRQRTRNVAHVVVGLDRTLSYEDLTLAVRLIERGAEFIGTNPDPTYPLADGTAPECGAILAAIQSATGKPPLIMGKPSREIFLHAAAQLGLKPGELLMVGDRLDTDVLGARRAGIGTVLVLTGHSTRRMLKRSAIQPDYVVESLAELR